MNKLFAGLLDYLLYGLAFLSNVLVVFSAPLIYSNSFLFIYSSTSLIFGIFVVLIFGTIRFSTISIWILLSMIPVIALYFFLQKNGFLWFAYTITLLISDYIASQKGGVGAAKLNRLLNILSAIPFYFYPNDFLVLIILRLSIFFLMSFVIVFNRREFSILNLKAPFFYVISTHVAYFFPLMIVSRFFEGQQMKFWYLGFQAGLGAILKVMDFAIRKNSKKNEVVNSFLLFTVLMIPFLLMIRYPSILLLLVYSIASIFLLKLQAKIC